MSDEEAKFSAGVALTGDFFDVGSDDEASKPVLLKKKKKSEKPGYKMFDAMDSDNDPVLYDDQTKAPTSKLKKHGKPSFKFANKIKLKDKDERKDVKEREEKKEREDKPEKRRKIKSKDHKLKKKKDKLPFGSKVPVMNVVVDSPVFGVPLSVALERTPSQDGVKLPVCVRECIDFIEEHGLLYEGIYRITGVKSKVQHLKECYNRQQPAHLFEHDPSTVASLLKQFLRELPESVLTNALMHKFEEASVVQLPTERLEKLRACINALPPGNKELLSWMIVHMTHVIKKEQINKMTLQNVSIVLSPTMRISHRVLYALFSHAGQLFSHIEIKRYVPTLQPAASKWSVDMPETEEAISDELHRQEAQLAQLHQELARHAGNHDQEERLWEVQRNVTQLKRKLKIITKTKAARQLEERLSLSERSDPKRRSINAAELNFALQTGLLRQSSRSSQIDLASTPTASHTASTEAIAVRSSKEFKGESPLCVVKRAHPTDLDLSNVQSDTSGLSQNAEMDEESTPLSPGAKLPEASDAISPEDENAQTLTERALRNAMEMKPSSSQDSDITLSAHAAGMSGSVSQQSFSDENVSKQETESHIVQSSMAVKTEDERIEPIRELAAAVTQGVLDEVVQSLETAHIGDTTTDINDTATHVNNTVAQQYDAIAKEDDTGVHADDTAVHVDDRGVHVDDTGVHVDDTRTRDDDTAVHVDEMASHVADTVAPEVDTATQDEPVTEDALSDSEEQVVREATSSEVVRRTLDTLSVLEATQQSLEAAVSNDQTTHIVTTVTGSAEDDDEVRRLIAEEAQLIWEEEELIAINDEIKQKICTEMIEVERLHEEIAEYEELRSITTYGHSSEGGGSSDEYYTSTSDTDPATDDEGYNELDLLVSQLDDLTQQNKDSEVTNKNLAQKIHEERMICLGIKIQIRLLQQQMLASSAVVQVQSLI